VEVLKQIAPGVTRAAVLRDPASTTGIGQFAVIQSVAPSAGVEVIPFGVRDAAGIERDVSAFARSTREGMIVSSDGRPRAAHPHRHPQGRPCGGSV
jgi:ABC-type uncharacterized transport system substrate-binding protein